MAGLSIAGILLVSCQSDFESVSKDVALNKVKPPPSTEVQESLGTNGAEITLLVERGPNGYLEGRSRDVRDGAALAVGELGADQVKVKVVPVAADGRQVQAEIAAAKTRNSLMLISYGSSAITKAASSVPARDRPLLVNLAAPTSGDGVINFAIDEADSAAQGAKIAIIGGKTNFVLLTQSDYPSDFDARVRAGIEKLGGRVTGSVRYEGGGVGVVDALRAAKAAISAADVVLIAGNTPATVTVITALKSAGAKPDVALVGTSAWDQQTYSSPAAKGALLLSFGRDNFALIRDRYNRHFNHTPSDASAYGYDAVALAAGIVRVDGAQAITLQKLTRQHGFAGITGLFNINKNGVAERKLMPFAVGSGGISPLE
ncbi:ABC transporter substrate-binding protein [Pseudomonas sp. R2.Fl]|nr:ABC transporter substrate-binding protein [Pseudomonas sp. R2.Fl]